MLHGRERQQADLRLDANCEHDLLDSQQRPRFHFKRAAAPGLNTTLPTEDGTQALGGGLQCTPTPVPLGWSQDRAGRRRG